MNRTYALVWNPSLATWSVANEHARRRGKGAGAVLATALLLSGGAVAADLPTGGQVVAGQGQIGTPSNNQMVIDQASNKLAIDWQSFDIGKGSKVTFNQPGSDSIALNRVLGADGSKIMGQLDANGRVFIVNPNGVLFGQNAQVNVGRLVASTLDISNSDFEAGNYSFKGNGSNASVINNGQITAADGGAVALLGGTVSNNGVIVANQGTVALAAGNKVTLDFAGDGLLNVQVDEAVVDALVENRQLIKADGGQVLLTANAGEALLKTVVNNTGVIEAQTLGEKDGKIVLLGSFDGGTVQVAGTLDASAPKGGNGGFIETSGAHVKVADNAKVTTKAQSGKTGTWLIDPNDFNVAASGGDMTGAAVSAAVQNNNFEIQTATMGTAGGNGDIHVNDAITWNSANTLTLNAERNINVNAAITAQHANGKVALKYGQNSSNGDTADYYIDMDKGGAINLQSGQNFSTQKGSSGSLSTYTVVNTAADLQNIGLTGNWAVGSQIDLSSIANWQPIGLIDGNFDGLGHTLSGLTIDRSQQSEVGLFSSLYNARVRNVGLVNASVMGGNYVGALVGMSTNSSISNVFATGNLTGNNIVGGLVGSNSAAFNGVATINNAYASVNVTGTGNAGSGTTVGNSVGGLAGENRAGFGSSVASISHTYATGSVTANSTGSGMPGNTSAGGLVGSNSAHYDSSSANISYAYATGSVTLNDTGSEMLGNTSAGGLVGENRASFDSSSANINYAYATGSVTLNDAGSGMPGITSAGGLVGENWASFDSSSANINYAYWDINTSGQTTSAVGTGKTTAEMQQQSTYSGWDFSSIWHITSTGAGTDGYAFYGLPTLQGVTPKTAYQYFESGFGTEATPWTLTNWQQLQNINQIIGQTEGKHFALTTDLDQNSLGYSTLASATANNGAGWKPLGNGAVGITAFRGTFNGRSHTISGLTIDRRSESGIGLFGTAGAYSTILDIGLVDSSVSGRYYVGGLVGLLSNSTISNAYATGTIKGDGAVGGLVGYNDQGKISDAYATGTITGGNDVGGLVGQDNLGTISNAYATATVKGDRAVGGLLGTSYQSTINDSFYATTDADGNAINNGGATSGAFAGNGNGNGTGKTWAELTLATTFAGWDIATTGGSNKGWRLYEGYSIPLLRSFLQRVTLTASTSSKTYDGSSITASVADTSGLDIGKLLGSLVYTSESKNVGTYSSAAGSLVLSGLHSGQQGYDISYADTSLVIGKADLAVTGISASDKTYNANTTAALTGTASVIAFGSDAVSVSGTGTGTFTDKNVGTNKAVTVTGYTLTGSDAGNYNILQPTNLTANITKADLAVTGISASDKAYDATAAAPLTGTASVSALGSDAVSVSGTGTGTFTDKNAGTNKAVTVTGYTLTGSDAGNYILKPTSLTANIAKASISAVTGITAQNRTYDGTTDASLNYGNAGFTGLIGSDKLNVSAASGTFADKNAGTEKTVNITGITLGGADAANYSLANDTATATADIAKASISAVTGITAQNRTYDGTTDAPLNYGNAGFTGLIGSDQLNVNAASGAFANKNAGNGKTVNITGIVLGGNDAANYSLANDTATTTADIAQAALTITALDASKPYDGQAFSGGNGVRYNGFVNGEDASVLGGSLTYGGNAQGATNTGHYVLSASGLSADNYAISYTDGALQIIAAVVEPSLVGSSQPYVSVLAANSQTVSSESKQQAQESEALTQDMLVTNPLDERLNLQVINHGIRLPEGI